MCLRDVWAALRVVTKVGRPGLEDKGRFAGQTAEKCHRLQGHGGVPPPPPRGHMRCSMPLPPSSAWPCRTRCALQRVPGMGAHAQVQILGAKSYPTARSIGERPLVLEFVGNWLLTDAQLCRRRLSHRWTVWTAATEHTARRSRTVWATPVAHDHDQGLNQKVPSAGGRASQGAGRTLSAVCDGEGWGGGHSSHWCTRWQSHCWDTPGGDAGPTARPAPSGVAGRPLSPTEGRGPSAGTEGAQMARPPCFQRADPLCLQGPWDQTWEKRPGPQAPGRD